jgi:hypothetical protein
MKYGFASLPLFLALLDPATAFAYDTTGAAVAANMMYSSGAGSSPHDGVGFRLGANILAMHDQRHERFLAVSIPSIEIDYPIIGRYLQAEFGFSMQWGISKFYVDHFPDFPPSIGLRVYPIGKYVSGFASVGASTFLFNKWTTTLEAGLDVDVPVGRKNDTIHYVTVGASAFRRDVEGEQNFIHGSQWEISSTGVAFRVGFRGRVLGDW